MRGTILVALIRCLESGCRLQRLVGLTFLTSFVLLTLVVLHSVLYLYRYKQFNRGTECSKGYRNPHYPQLGLVLKSHLPQVSLASWLLIQYYTFSTSPNRQTTIGIRFLL